MRGSDGVDVDTVVVHVDLSEASLLSSPRTGSMTPIDRCGGRCPRAVCGQTSESAGLMGPG
jgi:hypothetical protein